MDNGDLYDPAETPPIRYPPPLLPSRQQELAAPTSWPRQDGAAGTPMMSELEEDGTSVAYNINTFRNSSPAIDVAHRQDNMIHAKLENSPEASSTICVNVTHATGYEQHPYRDRESPRTQTIQPLEYRESPLPEQTAYPAISNIESANNSSPIQEELSYGPEELAISNIAHDKKKRVFRNRQHDVVPDEHRPAAMELKYPAMTAEGNTTRNDGPDEIGRRLDTFTNWPKESIVSAYRLAKAGFVFVGRPDRPDLTMCVKCKGTLHSWEKGDNPRDEHLKFFKKACFD